MSFPRELIQLRLVIDANIVREEIRSRLRIQMLRSALQEVIDSGIAVPLAQCLLDAEIERHIGNATAYQAERIDRGELFRNSYPLSLSICENLRELWRMHRWPDSRP